MPEQRINRWKMVTDLYTSLGKSFMALGHQVYFYIHPEAMTENALPQLTWNCVDHEHFDYVLDRFAPDFVFTWNGSSIGDETTATLSQAHGAKMVFSEQGWFPQKDTMYFDLTGCNGKCSTKNTTWAIPEKNGASQLLAARKKYITQAGLNKLFDVDTCDIAEPNLSKPIFVPLQDEHDLNILLDSPFKCMDSFVSFLCKTYPRHRFIVRPHPKYQKPNLDNYDNVELVNPRIPMFEQLSRCGIVIGLNSTTLLESALLGFPVISYGVGLGTGTGVFHDAIPEAPPALEEVQINQENATGFLYHLICQKQIKREHMAKPLEILKSQLFRDLKQQLNWNVLSR
ncbi:DUF354 domain-containing protein [Maridesulfovibrio bastinii]|uniref:DUF354 domain-containing protein n=1 Tax=Maridesulfovibrio bastinii TaxID=47157 RepID=UPI001B7F9E63|nr:DUF354 domain-containing protein [Maridesulfovibrio bastinii]